MENLLKKIWQFIKTRSPYVLVIALLLIILFFQKECGGRKCPDCPEATTVTTVEYVHDTTLIVKTEYVPKWITKIEYVPTPYALPVDTVEILADYFAAYVYSDTAMDDTLAWLVIHDTITQNKIASRNIEYRNRKPTQIINNTMITQTCKKWNIGVGGFAGGNLTRFEAGVGIIATTNNRSSYGLEFNAIDRSFRIGYYWNLRK